MEAYRSAMLGFGKIDNGKVSVSVGDAKESYVFGWIDEHGLYLWSQDGTLVQISTAQLLSIGDNIDLLRLVRMEKEMGKDKTDN